MCILKSKSVKRVRVRGNIIIHIHLHFMGTDYMYVGLVLMDSLNLFYSHIKQISTCTVRKHNHIYIYARVQASIYIIFTNIILTDNTDVNTDFDYICKIMF